MHKVYQFEVNDRDGSLYLRDTYCGLEVGDGRVVPFFVHAIEGGQACDGGQWVPLQKLLTSRPPCGWYGDDIMLYYLKYNSNQTAKKGVNPRDTLVYRGFVRQGNYLAIGNSKDLSDCLSLAYNGVRTNPAIVSKELAAIGSHVYFRGMLTGEILDGKLVVVRGMSHMKALFTEQLKAAGRL